MTRTPIVFAAVVFLSGIAAAPVARASDLAELRLTVGPRLTAAVRTADMHLSCSDDARCRFEVPSGSALEIVASGPTGHRFQWTGCKSQSQADRCLVDMRHSTTITVR